MLWTNDTVLVNVYTEYAWEQKKTVLKSIIVDLDPMELLSFPNLSNSFPLFSVSVLDW